MIFNGHVHPLKLVQIKNPFGFLQPTTQIPQEWAGFYRTQVSLGSGLWVPVSLYPTALRNFTDVTLADDDTNSI